MSSLTELLAAPSDETVAVEDRAGTHLGHTFAYMPTVWPASWCGARPTALESCRRASAFWSSPGRTGWWAGSAIPCEPAALEAFARELLAPYKVPRAFVILDELPTNALGEVLKPALAARLGRRGT